MGLGRYLRRHVARPVIRQIDMQSELLCEMHTRELLSTPPYNSPKRLEAFGYRSFSQNDEDGIIEEIFRRIGAHASTFVEFGVGDGLENNSRLLLYRGWSGLWMEADGATVGKISRAFQAELATKRLQLLRTLITTDNINALIDSAGLGEIDLVSIDIDGNDYWIWQAIAARPRVVIIEYNAKFRPSLQWVMEYDPEHRWNGTDYHGAALQSLANLGRSKGYTLVGCGLAGVNAFFVRDDLVGDWFAEPDVTSLYNPPRFYLRSFLSCGHPAGAFGKYRSV